MEGHRGLVGSDIEFHEYQRGCLLSILKIIVFQQKSDLKSTRPPRKRSRRKDVLCCRNPKTLSLKRSNEEEREAEDNPQPIQVEEKASMSTKPDTNLAICREILVGKLSSQSVELPCHSRSSSITDYSGPRAYWSTPIVILQKATDADSTSLYPLGLSAESSNHDQVSSCLNTTYTGLSFNDYVGSLDIIQVNKRLLEMLRDSECRASRKKSTIRQNSLGKLKLLRSGSFPVDNSSTGGPKHLTLEHKLSETWSFPKMAGHPSDALSTSESDGAVRDCDDTCRAVPNCEQSQCSPDVAQVLSKYDSASSLLNYIIYLKNKLKRAMRQGKKPKEFTVCGEFVSGKPSLTMSSSSTERTEMKVQSDAGGDDRENLQRSESSNDFVKFMENCSQLLENSSSRGAPKHQYQSQSVKMANNASSSSRRYGLNRFSRRLSMPDMEYLVHYSDTISKDDSNPQMAFRMDSSTNNTNAGKTLCGQHSATQSIDISDKQTGNIKCSMVEEAEEMELPQHSANVCAVTVAADQEMELQQIEIATNEGDMIAILPDSIDIEENQSPVSVLESHYAQDDMPFEFSKGLALEPISTESYISVAQEQLASEDFIARSEANNDTELKTSTATKYLSIKPISSGQDTNPDSQYVIDVLHISGFVEQECLTTWFSLDRPLNPRLFNDLEAILYPGQNHSCDRKVLFDLVNEALLEIFESLLSYFPRHLSSTRRVCPVPKGRQVQSEVWNKVSWWKSFCGRANQSLNDTTERDLSRDDGWMALQFDAEDVALDVEDVIFDDLLNETVAGLV